LGAAVLTVLVSLAISFLKNKNSESGPVRNSDIMVVRTVEIKDEVKDKVKPKEKPPQKSTAAYKPIVVVPDDKADKELPDIEKIDKSVIGKENLDGVPVDGSDKQTSDENGKEEKGVKDEPEVKQPDLPSYPPEFPGGNASWIAFLQKYLQSPDDLEPGQRVEVLVQFWVDVDGSVSRAEVIKSGGSSFDKEVLRVLKKMPKWKPAMQHGNLVAVAYKQPVTFMGVE